MVRIIRQSKRFAVSIALVAATGGWVLATDATAAAGLATKQDAEDAPPASPAAPAPEVEEETPAERYTRAMLIGYAAAEDGDFHTALINFRRALAARPGDRYALAAIANMEAYIAVERAEAAKRQRVLDLQAQLAEAVAIRDWSCAAASVDELITLVPPDSLVQSQLITYRGELSGFLEARDTVENWSSVCPGWLPEALD